MAYTLPSDENPHPTPASFYASLNDKQLAEHAHDRGLPTKGTRTDLLERLTLDDEGGIINPGVVHLDDLTPIPDDLAELDAIAQLELDNGFQFGNPDGTTSPRPTRSLICRNPECSMSGAHVAVHADTAQPIRCGGLITDTSTGDTRPCSAVLLCDHTPVTTTTTEGTLAAPTEITRDICTKCQTTTAQTTTALPPINLGTLPAGILNTPIGGGPSEIA